MAEHNTLTGASLHESKGVAGALSNHVYVTDGAGSGDHTQISPANTVMIHSASDFPTAVAGVRTLADNTIYAVSGSVSIGSDRIVLGANTTLCGNSPLLDGVVSTTANALLTVANNFFLSKIFFTVASGSVFDLNGSGTQITLIDQVRIVSCDTIGTVDQFALFTVTDMLVQAAASNGLTLSGANGNFRITNGTFTVAAGIVFDLGVATADGISFSGINVDNASGVTGIDIAAAGANINSGGQGTISNCTFLTPATATVGYAAGDNKWTMVGSVGVPRSTAVGQGSITDSALATTFSGTGSGNDVAVNFGAAFVSDVARRFTISTAGLITYDGDVDIEAIVTASMFSTIAGGAARTYNFYIAKNGTIIASSVSQSEYDGTNPDSSAISSVVELVSTDTIQLFVRAETATTSITVDTCSLKIIQVSD